MTESVGVMLTVQVTHACSMEATVALQLQIVVVHAWKMADDEGVLYRLSLGNVQRTWLRKCCRG